MQLIIAEKPSVAHEIAAVLGANERHDGYLQGRDHLVSWCFGHLVELAMPDQYDSRYARWKREDLPILPGQWEYVVSAGTRKQFDVLKRLMHDKRVNTVVCATDAGREGELIFRLVYEKAACRLPVKRLWISSLEEKAILDGFRNLKDGQAYDPLYQAALCREHADWLVGINASRLFSLLYGQTLKVGRVMTPTLAMIVEREDAIRAFRPETFYTVQLSMAGFVSQSERFASAAEAEQLRSLCMAQNAVVTSVQTKEKVEKPPRLYDLTSLQRDANKLLGFTAQQTLDCAQALYEKKVITYPRTDSRYLTSDMEQMLPDHVRAVADTLPCIAGLAVAVHPGQVIDDSKVSDHHAIIPTRSMPRNRQVLELPASERAVLNLICARLVCAVADPCIYEETTVTMVCGGHTFTSKGRRIKQIGWQAPQNAYDGTVGSRREKRNAENLLPEIVDGQCFQSVTAEVKEGMTSAPESYTEASILAAMEKAGTEDMPEDAEHLGIGTPATRAATLEKLIQDGLVQRTGSGKTKHLIPTQKGVSLIAVVPQQIQSAAMTADWENRLKQIEHGFADPVAFMNDITQMLRDLTMTAERVDNADVLFPSGRESLGKCPSCGSPVSETAKGFFCENSTCRFGVWKDNRILTGAGKPPTAEMIRRLLHDGVVKLNGLTSKKTGKPYDAALQLECADDGSARLRFAFI